MATTFPSSFDLEQSKLQRQQAVLDALMVQTRQPSGQFVNNAAGTFYTGGTEQELAKGLLAFAGAGRQKELDRQTADLTDRFNAGQQEAVGEYLNLRQGTGETPGDPRAAAIKAIASQYPAVRALGEAELKRDPLELFKAVAPHADPASLPAIYAGGMGAFKPKRELGEVGGTIYDKGTLQTVQLGGAKPTTALINGDLYEQSPSTQSLRKLDNAPKLSINNTVLNKGPSKLAEKLAETAAKDYETATTGVQSAKQSLDAVAKMKSLGPTYIGPTANAAMFVSGVANALGVPIDQKKLANSQTFESESAQAWIQMMNQAGGSRGLVKEESDRIAKAVPNLVHSPEGRAQLMQMIEDRAKKTIEVGERKRQALIRAGKADDPTKYFEEVTASGLEGVPASSPLGGQAPAAAPSWLPPGAKILQVR